jgi:phosphate transport system substrate-binding protein
MKKHLIAAAALMSLVTSAPVLAEEVRINGSTTVIDQVVVPHKAAVEKSTGLTVVVAAGGTGRGLADLLDGKCDASMASDALEDAAAGAKGLGKAVDVSKLQFHLLVNSQTVFITNKSNPVKTLTWQQVQDIHSGKIANWKEVGGKDMPITVYTEPASSGTRGMVKSLVLEGKEFGPNTKPLPSPKRIVEVTATTEGALGDVGISFADTEKVNIVQTKKLNRPLAMVTIGDPSPKVAKIIAAFKAEAGK